MDITAGIKGVIFDLDGTLFNLNIDWEKLRKDLETIIGRSFTTLDTLFDRSNSYYAEVVDCVTRAEVAGVEHGRAAHGAFMAVNTVRSQFKVGVATSNSELAATHALRKIGISVDSIVARDTVNKIKPNPEAIHKVLQELQIEPKAALVVGDTHNDVIAAREAGCLCIIIKNPLLDFTPKDADLYLDDLAQFVELFNKGEKL